MKISDENSEVRFGESNVSALRKIRANILLSSFSGNSEDIYRAVHFFKDNLFFFADYAKEFFYRTQYLLNSGKILEIRRLLVFMNDNEINSEESQRIIQFHSFSSGYACKIINANDYSAIRKDYKIHPNIDFGIFGNKRVYKARTDRLDYVIGSWSSKKKVVEKYIQLFDTCWKRAYTPIEKDSHSFDSGRQITIGELFQT